MKDWNHAFEYLLFILDCICRLSKNDKFVYPEFLWYTQTEIEFIFYITEPILMAFSCHDIYFLYPKLQVQLNESKTHCCWNVIHIQTIPVVFCTIVHFTTRGHLFFKISHSISDVA